MQTAGNIIIFAGIVFMLFGVVGIFRFKNFYARILVAAIIDTVGVFTVIIGIAVKHGLGFFSMKLLLLIILTMIINPLLAHIMAGSAYLSKYKNEPRHTTDDKDDI